MKFKVTDIVYIGVVSGLVLIGTFINFKLPFVSQGGLVHLGTPIAIVGVLVLKPRIGIFSGAIGMSLFDIMGGYAAWAPATFIARIGLGYLFGKIAFFGDKDGNNYIYNLAGLIIGGLFMLTIYYLFEAIFLVGFGVALASIPGNVTQLVLTAIIGIPLGMVLKKYIKIKE